MPPSLPAPSTANFLSESLRDIVKALPHGEAVHLLFPMLTAASISRIGIENSGTIPRQIRTAPSPRRTPRVPRPETRKPLRNVHSSDYRSAQRPIGAG